TDLYTLSLHDALPICTPSRSNRHTFTPSGSPSIGAEDTVLITRLRPRSPGEHMPTDTPMQLGMVGLGRMGAGIVGRLIADGVVRSEEHTSELQSLRHL